MKVSEPLQEGRLITLLLSEVEHCEHAPAPHPIASRVLDLAIKHPEVLSTLLFFIDWRPTLLADMVLKPETSALACLLISKWRTASGAWDRQVTARDNEAARGVAFLDALAVMCHHVQSEQLRPAEVAALLHELHMRVANGDDSAPTGSVMLAALRSELVGFPRPILVAIFDALVSGPYRTEVGLPAFSAALDLVEVGQLIADVDCSPLVGAYVKSIRQPNYQLSAAQISPEGAARLFEMSEQLGLESLSEFLSPVDVKGRLASSVSADENQYIVAQELARSLRAHMRVLARAIIGQRARVPQPLIKAFNDAISSATVADSGKGRIAAFPVRFERPPTGRPREAGLAEDFGEALHCVSDSDGARLLEKILEIGEPAFLAQLCASSPASMQSVLRERIRKLGPSQADTAWHFTEPNIPVKERVKPGAPHRAELAIFVGFEAREKLAIDSLGLYVLEPSQMEKRPVKRYVTRDARFAALMLAFGVVQVQAPHACALHHVPRVQAAQVLETRAGVQAKQGQPEGGLASALARTMSAHVHARGVKPVEFVEREGVALCFGVGVLAYGFLTVLRA